MKAKLFLLLALFSALPLFSARSQTVVTFDDFNVTDTYQYTINIPNGYQGLNWANFYIANSLVESNVYGMDGYVYGMVSPSNVAFNADGYPAGIDSPGTNFNFLSAYFTGAWNSNLNIEVQGYRDTNLIYDQTVVASATNPTLFTFNYLDIDRLYFDSYGGEPAGLWSGAGEQFVMDNFIFEFIPEPSSLLLTIFGAFTLWAIVKRRAA